MTDIQQYRFLYAAGQLNISMKVVKDW